MPVWYEDTPTVWNQGNGHTVYINATEEMRAALKKDAVVKEWVDKADAEDSFITVVTRAAVPEMLKDVDPKLVTDAKLEASTLDIAKPTTGTTEEKAKAEAVKLATPISVAEYEKLKALADTVVKEIKVAPMEEIAG